MQPMKHFAWLAMLCLLAACASMTTPQTAEQRLAYVDSQFTAVVQTLADLREQGTLTAEDAENMDPAVQSGDAALDAAWTALDAGDEQEALRYMRTANMVLIELQNALQEKQND